MTDGSCVFCKIILGVIPAKKQYEDDEFLVFDDIAHTAPIDVLVVPKNHVLDLNTADVDMLGKLQAKLPKIADKLGIGSGYRIILNAGKYQEVPHLHYHLKGGE